jgi:hypothetical protein
LYSAWACCFSAFSILSTRNISLGFKFNFVFALIVAAFLLFVTCFRLP